MAVLLAPTSAPQISMSVFAETDEAVVAPAALAQALERRARDLLAAARVGDRAGDDDGLARQRRVGGDLRREVLVAHVEVDAELAQPRRARRASRRG